MTTAPKPLAERLIEEIRRNGPIRLDTYMTACLADPLAGYYSTRDPFGPGGDFITAPEISQIFGELVGLWTVATWQAMGAPNSFHLIEFGPGRGTLMSDALRAMRVSPECAKAVNCHLIEISPTLHEKQAETLSAATCPISWHTQLVQVPPGPSIIVANEFLDALPIRQFVKRGAQWHERLITVDDQNRFQFTLSQTPASPLPFPLDNIKGGDDGSIFETRQPSNEIIAQIAGRAKSHPLAALFIDYGFPQSAFGETLQAVVAQKYADPLANPGQADLTAHVDFGTLAYVGKSLGLNAYGPVAQGKFLIALGLQQRYERLLANASEEQASLLSTGAQRLIDPEAMGELFKVLALTTPKPATTNPLRHSGVVTPLTR